MRMRPRRNTSRRVTFRSEDAWASKFDVRISSENFRGRNDGVYDASRRDKWTVEPETRVHQRWFSSQPFITSGGVNRNESNSHGGRKAGLSKGDLFSSVFKKFITLLFLIPSLCHVSFFLRLRDNDVSHRLCLLSRIYMDLAENTVGELMRMRV